MEEVPMTRLRATALAAAITLAAAVHPAGAHEGHDHDAPPPPATVVSAPRAETASDAVELVAVARGGVIEIYLDDFRTNAPIEGASVEVETPEGPMPATATAGQPYRLAAPWIARPGQHGLIVTVAAGDLLEVMSLDLTIPEPATPPAPTSLISTAHAALAPGLPAPDTRFWLALGGAFLAGMLAMRLLGRRGRKDAAVALVLALAATPAMAQSPPDPPPVVVRDQAQRLPDGMVFVPKASQRILGLRTQVATSAAQGRTVELPGRIIPDPNASGYVQAAVSGRLSAPPGGFPRLGAPVRAGEVLAYVTPPFQAIDTSTIRQQAGELDQQLAIVERRAARLRALGDVAARSQLEEAELELRGLRTRRASLDQVRREPEALLAPIDGVIAASTAAAGRIAETNAVVFQVIDPSRLWVEALQVEPLDVAREATALLAGGRGLKLAWRGAGLTGAAQAVPVQFAIEDDATGLRVGQLVTVLARLEAVQEGLALPRAAVLRGAGGVAIVYEHSAAEQFRPHEVRTEALDATRVLVVAGLRPGQRIVTQGAELLNQVR
jgi:hypothetical protein